MSEQMMLGELIDELKIFTPTLRVTFDLLPDLVPTGFASYRGIYADLAIGYSTSGNPTVADLLQWATLADGDTFDGYKGGHYTMSRTTMLWMANRSYSGQRMIVGVKCDDWGCELQTEDQP